MPIALADGGLVCSAPDGNTPAILLGTIDSIVKIIVGGDVVELRGRLIILERPSNPAVDRDRGAPIVGLDHTLGSGGINPWLVIVTVRNRQCIEMPASVG